MKLLPAVLFLVAVTGAVARCAQYGDCKSCAGVNGCGWCSTQVDFTNGTKGPQCIAPNEGTEFTCAGLYSTDVCLQGWECDRAVGACRPALPGQGVDFATCNAACTVGPADKVYGCQNGSSTCVVVPPGSPGSASREECERHCITPPAEVYLCNPNTKRCDKVAPGTPGSTSLLVCQASSCDSGTWGCDLNTFQCVEGKGTQSNFTCAKDCRPSNDPCTQYDSCDKCLSQTHCGWCSQNVKYVSGQPGGRCAGVAPDIVPFTCEGTYSTKKCSGPPSTPAPTDSPYLPPRVDCPKGSMVLLQYNCKDRTCSACDTGAAAQCFEPHCTYYCSGKCQGVPAFGTSFMWSCNGDPSVGSWSNATLVHFLQSDKCVGPTNPPGIGGSGTYPLQECASPYGPNNPPEYNTFRCVPCGASCDWH